MLSQKSKAQNDRKHGQRHHAPAGSLRQFFTVERDPGTPGDDQDRQKRRERQFDEVARGEANWIVWWQGVDLTCKIGYITNLHSNAARSGNDSQYLPALTGLRFLLGMWVILHHLTGKNMLLDQWNQTLPFAAQSIFRGGYLAVQTFFLLSGFVLAQSYATTRWNRQSLKRFAIARFARIYPAYLLSLILVSWFVFEFLLKSGRSAAQKAAVVGDYAFVLQGWTGSLNVGWNTPAWSLSCEFFFYLCFPLLFLWLGRGGLTRVLAALGACFVTPILLAHAGVPGIWKPVHHLSDFVAGIAAARIYGVLVRSGMAAKATKRLGFWL
jgi:peptidoglycan/LPS O-acetylase OafA/YrhL